MTSALPGPRTSPRRRSLARTPWPAAILALSLLAAGCTGGGDGAGGAERSVVPKPGKDESRDIFVASGRDVTGKGGVRQQLIDDWNAEQRAANGARAYRAHLVELSGSADQQRSQLLGALQSGGADYDVVNLDVTWVPEFAEAGLVRPLSEDLLDDDVIDSVARTARWHGDVYSVPFNSDVGLLYYRPDYLETADLEDTDLRGKVKDWSDLEEVINDVNRAEMPPQYKAGWTTQLKDYEGRTVNAVEAFASSGDEGAALTDDQGRYTGNKGQLLSGISDLRARTAQALTLTYKADEAGSLADFAAGKTAFLRHWPYAYGALSQTFGKDQLQVIPLPGKAVLGGQNLAVTRDSPHFRAAQDLIRVLTDKNSQCRLLRAGFAATRTSAYEDDKLSCPEDRTAAPSTGSGESADRMPRDEQGRPLYASDTLLDALRGAALRPRTPYYGAFTQAVRTELAPLFGEGPSKSNEKLAEDLDTALRRAMPTAG
ncbi:extracellular solute-binding protein [Streptomyces sp. NBC_00247]|uniref:extracellular solute-binding protein n=1 Tax=Streptomyces sp. NBC_00247 TaxID=2975689 RepID=UPI002E2BD1B5|nr:extracellular solute-binding protein [Streptomyces sp. NBC_00247]